MARHLLRERIQEETLRLCMYYYYSLDAEGFEKGGLRRFFLFNCFPNIPTSDYSCYL